MYRIEFSIKAFPLSLIFLVSCSCNTPLEFDRSAEKDKILMLHNLQREYHFNKDPISFANQLSDNFISVNKGRISNPKREETVKRYTGYFSSVEFIKWDDVAEPIVKFADDGSMAYTVVDKIVSVIYNDENGNTVEGQTRFAWTTIYKKYGNEWKIDCVISTERPDENNNEN
ncbi:MAG: nuclear transport factor 2 family protein [Sinomicrobium sp.]|nr:nuclear transport factor 2 family protein [Sinomicrobium sp.]